MRNGQYNWCLLTDRHSMIDKSEGLKEKNADPHLTPVDKNFSAL